MARTSRRRLSNTYQHLCDRETFVTALAFVDVKNLTTDDIVDINSDKWIVSHRRICASPQNGEAADSELARLSTKGAQEAKGAKTPISPNNI